MSRIHLDRLPRALRVPPLVALAMAVARCGPLAPDGLACTDEARASVSVTVRDSVTDVPLGRRASVILQDGAFVDSLQMPDDPASDGQALTPHRSYERAGTYEVRVRRDGYAPWTRSGVVVRAGECHVQTVSLIARLQGAP